MEPPQNNDQSNPLFDLPARKDKVVEPLHPDTKPKQAEPAVNLIRQKIETLYAKEPSAKKELAEAETARHRSKHQQFMHELSSSGRSLAEIQTAWHNYYVNLPDREKHEVWQEFYANYNSRRAPTYHQTAQPEEKPPTARRHSRHHQVHSEPGTVSEVKSKLLGKVSHSYRKRSPRTKSILFGLGMGSIAAVILLFGFFNERFIAPFITPSKNISSTPIILDSSAAVDDEPKIIIPKINVEIPVVYDEQSIEEKAVQRALERGVLHYATTSKPGEKGNAAIFGHSSNNILNSGKYKFAFVLLNRLESGDTFILHYEGKRYVYKVYKKDVVSPEQISVLSAQDKSATVTLITCDPPGTALKRLVVVGEQITPDPNRNVASSVDTEHLESPAVLPSNAPSLWSRLMSWLSS